ncbi:MAG TPA: class I SAM-dependent methyltransferase [Candidatus Sulfotelmatobacter sp.]|jgi:2-polyprenyl-3-methyl-5-hydroxy-6-metoxy-1,4-benzoquinol methylase|nr:class I SAM-dependent methyltransferase [Candidatus Sulfotelmatobacter sp.]
MKKQKKKKLYETYHGNRKLQKHIISDNNFTYREIIKLFKEYSDQYTSVLDIGSGVGTIGFYLASKGKKVTGIEISKNAVKIAKANAKSFELDKNINFINAEFPHKVHRENYDLVIFSEVIEHLENDQQVLQDIRTVLKPGGLLIITTPSISAPLYKMGLLTSFDKEVGHLRRYTEEELKTLVKENGYKIISVGQHEGIIKNFLFTNPIAGKFLRFVKWNFSDLISAIDSATIPLFGASNIHLIAKK